MDEQLKKVSLETSESTKSTHKISNRVEDLDKKVRELDHYAHDRCENQPFIRVENLAKIQSEVSYKVENAENMVHQT